MLRKLFATRRLSLRNDAGGNGRSELVAGDAGRAAGGGGGRRSWGGRCLVWAWRRRGAEAKHNCRRWQEVETVSLLVYRIPPLHRTHHGDEFSISPATFAFRLPQVVQAFRDYIARHDELAGKYMVGRGHVEERNRCAA